MPPRSLSPLDRILPLLLQGFLGLSVMQFKDWIARIGGIHPRGPCATADLSPGDIIVSIDGTLVHELKLDDIADLITMNKGMRVKIGIYEIEDFDFEAMLAEETERQVWFQQGEESTMGIKLGATTRGNRITEFFPAESHARYTGLAVGDVMVGVNANDVSSSSDREILAAFVLTSSPVLTVLHDSSSIVMAKGAISPQNEETMLRSSSAKSTSSRRLRDGRGRGATLH